MAVKLWTVAGAPVPCLEQVGNVEYWGDQQVVGRGGSRGRPAHPQPSLWARRFASRAPAHAWCTGQRNLSELNECLRPARCCSWSGPSLHVERLSTRMAQKAQTGSGPPYAVAADAAAVD